jgi:hypothetical protein
MDTPRQRARRQQLWLSIVVTGLVGALAAAVTWAMVLRHDLPLLVQIALPAVFWIWVVWSGLEFRKIYVRMGISDGSGNVDT